MTDTELIAAEAAVVDEIIKIKRRKIQKPKKYMLRNLKKKFIRRFSKATKGTCRRRPKKFF